LREGRGRSQANILEGVAMLEKEPHRIIGGVFKAISAVTPLADMFLSLQNLCMLV
jgi:hypothetical protein